MISPLSCAAALARITHARTPYNCVHLQSPQTNSELSPDLPWTRDLPVFTQRGEYRRGLAFGEKWVGVLRLNRGEACHDSAPLTLLCGLCEREGDRERESEVSQGPDWDLKREWSQREACQIINCTI